MAKYPREVRFNKKLRKDYDKHESLDLIMAKFPDTKIKELRSKDKKIKDLLGKDAKQIKNAFKNWDTISASQRWSIVKKVLKILLINEIKEG